jgi:hypothetical protein
VVRCVSYTKASGRAVVESSGGLVFISSGVIAAGGTLNFTSIPSYSSLRIVYRGAYNGASSLLNGIDVAISDDNGATHGSGRGLISVPGSGEFIAHGSATISGTGAVGNKTVTPCAQSVAFNSGVNTVTNFSTTSTETVETGVTNALQFTTQASGVLANIDLYGVP